MEAPVPLATAAKWSVFLELAGILALIATLASGQPPIFEVIGTILVFFGLSIGATVWAVYAQGTRKPMHRKLLVTVAVAGAFIGTVGLAFTITRNAGNLPYDRLPFDLITSGFGLVGFWLLFHARSPSGLGAKAAAAGTLAGVGLLIGGTSVIIAYYFSAETVDAIPTPIGFVLMLLMYPIWAWNVGRAATRRPAGEPAG